MIIISLIIIAAFVVSARYSLIKSFLTFAAVSISMNAAMAVRYTPPSISVQLILCVFYAICFFIKRKRFKMTESCFFSKAFIYVSLSYLISSFIAISNGGLSGLTSAILKILTIYFFIYLFWLCCRTKENIIYFTKVLIIIFSIAFVYGLYEYFSHSNPFLTAIMSNMPEEYAKDKIYLSDLESLRDGRARCQSVFYITILYGIFSLLFLFYILAIKSYKIINLNKFEIICLVAFSLFACYASNSKTPLVALPIYIIPYILKNRFLIFMDIIVISIFFIDSNILLSILGNVINLDAFNVNNDDMTEGSNLAMRIVQLQLSFDLWSQSPIWGNGLRSAAQFSETAKYAMILGTESVWFRLMIEQGVLGLLSYIYMIYAFLKASYRSHNKVILITYTLAFFLICSITDINYTLFFMCFIALYRMDILNNKHFIQGCNS